MWPGDLKMMMMMSASYRMECMAGMTASAHITYLCIANVTVIGGEWKVGTATTLSCHSHCPTISPPLSCLCAPVIPAHRLVGSHPCWTQTLLSAPHTWRRWAKHMLPQGPMTELLVTPSNRTHHHLLSHLNPLRTSWRPCAHNVANVRLHAAADGCM